MRDIRTFIVLIALLISYNSYAYKVLTHAELSSNAVNASEISNNVSLLENLGLLRFSQKEQFTNPENPAGKKLTIIELVRNGAMFEDNAPRFFNHFYNPINNAPLTVGVELGFASPDWALEDIGDVTSVLSGSQEYSYKEAMNYFFLALTSQTEEIREQNWGRVFQTLGQVIHHVQDMAQPDHVRNDQHNDVTDSSWYEEYTNDHKGDVYFTGLMSGNTYPVPEFPTARDFWTTQATDPAITNRRGMADFTNRNFVSKDSIFLLDNGIIVPSPDFPLPIPNITPTTVDIADPSIKGAQGQAVCDQIKAISLFPFPNSACFIDFVSTTITGAVAGEPTTNTRAASYSIFDKKLQDHNVDAIFTREDGSIDTIDRSFTLNEFNFKAAHEYLIPRAVAYSAGLINHFFRGKIDMIPNPSGAGWVIQNQTNEEMQGIFTLYYDYVDPVDSIEKRAVIPGASWNLTIAANSEVVVDVSAIPANLIVKTLVFSGRIGGENNIYAGKNVSNWSQPISIGTSLISTFGDVAIDAGGNAFVVYETYDNVIVSLWRQSYTPSDGWSEGILIDTYDSTMSGSMYVDSSGNIMVVYNSSLDRYEYRYYSADILTYTGLLDFSDTFNPAVTVGESGDFIEMSTDILGSNRRITSRYFTPTSSWISGELVDEFRSFTSVESMNLAMASNNVAMTIYTLHETISNSFSMLFRQYTPFVGWGSPIIFDNSTPSFAIALALNSSNTAMLLYGEGGQYYSRQYSTSGGWSNPEPWDEGFASIDMDDNGNAIAAFRDNDGFVSVKHRFSDIGWSKIVQLPEFDQQYASIEAIDVASSGKAVVIWLKNGVLWSNFYTP